MPTIENCPTSDYAYPRKYEGAMDFTITRNGAVVHTFSSQNVAGGWDALIGYNGTEAIEILYKASVEEDGEYRFSYEFDDVKGCVYFYDNTRYQLKGDVEVTTSQNGDRQDLKYSMTFFDGARMFDLEGDGYLEYKFL